MSKRKSSTQSEPSLSASLLLLSPLREEDAQHRENNYQVLLLKRSAKGSFTSAHVFPGGNSEPSDFDPKWNALLPRGSKDEEAHIMGMKVTAIRETFEECGILLETSPAALTDAKEWRQRVHDNADKFFELVNSRSPATTLGIEYLSPRGQWITPRALPRRWNTSFFITMLPSFENEAEHDVRGTADGTETVQLDWLTPKEALGRAMLRPDHPDRISLPPPQFYLLAELSVIRDWQDLVVDSTVPFPIVKPRKVFPFEPNIQNVTTDNGETKLATCLPHDHEYTLDTSTPEGEKAPSAPAPLHRTYVELKRKTISAYGIERRGIGTFLGPGWEDLKVIGELEQGNKL